MGRSIAVNFGKQKLHPRQLDEGLAHSVPLPAFLLAVPWGGSPPQTVHQWLPCSLPSDWVQPMKGPSRLERGEHGFIPRPPSSRLP